jgi:hypothetical protein
MSVIVRRVEMDFVVHNFVDLVKPFPMSSESRRSASRSRRLTTTTLRSRGRDCQSSRLTNLYDHSLETLDHTPTLKIRLL